MTKPKVPYTALPNQVAEIKGELLKAFETVIDSGRYILGPYVKEFEEKMAAFCGVNHALGVSNGTSALHLLLRTLKVGPGDEVITVSNTFLATASSIALSGAKPVFVDIDADLNMNPALLEAAITQKTKGIIPVHLTGRPARMNEILNIAKKHHLFVLEDAAQAIGAKLGNKRVGSWGDAAAFSLHPLKNLFAYGDGGMIMTNNQDFYEKMTVARNHGLRTREQCDFWSFNSRLDELQAALLLVHLTKLDQWTEERRRLAFRYNDLLKDDVDVPLEKTGEYCVYQTYVIQADRRDELQTFLTQNGVEALIHYRIPIHLQPAAKNLGYTIDDFPITKRACNRILSLPLFPGMTTSQQDLVVELISKFYQKNRS